MKIRRQRVEGSKGFSLIEIIVVVAIIGILATITGLAVSGTTQKGRGASKAADQETVTKASRSYTAEHNQGRAPTKDGCLPDSSLDTVTLICSSGSDAVGQFTVDETVVGTDVNNDGDETDTAVDVVPIVWAQSFTGDASTAKAFNPDFVDLPRRARTFIDKTSWVGNTSARSEDAKVIENPTFTVGTAPADCIAVATPATGDEGNCPVWVLNADGEAVALLSDGLYQ